MLTFLCKLFLAADSQGSLIADSLRDAPEDWTWQSHYVVHKSKLAVWHANEAYGLHVTLEYSGRVDKDWKPSYAERRLINAELKRWRRRADAQAKRQVRSKIEKALES